MPKATGKTTKKVITQEVIPTPVPTTVRKPMNNKVISLALVAVLIALITYKVGPWLVPSIVDNKLVTRFELWSRLEKSYGAQALDDMVNEKILDQAIAKAGIKIDQAKLDEQMSTLEKQFETSGGLDEALKQRGLTRTDLIKQVKTQLSVEELLADKINPTEEEIKAQFDSGATTIYKDKKYDEMKATVTEELKQAKLRDAFLVWFADVKKEAKVKSFGL